MINAMSAQGHPCEVLGDAFWLQHRFGSLQGLRFCLIGPPTNVLRSWVEMCELFSLDYIQATPPGYAPSDAEHVAVSLEEGLRGADVVLTDAWPAGFDDPAYQVTRAKLGLAAKRAVLIPCPPFNTAREVSEDAIASPRFAGYGQKAGLYWMHMAIVTALLDREWRGKSEVSAEPIEIHQGLPEGYRHQAAEIYDHAFHLKLTPMLGPRERCIAVIEQILDPTLALSAYQGERLVGVAGLQYGGKSYVPARPGPFIRELGLLRGLFSYAAFALLFVSHRKVELLIESLAVAPDMRGQGVGTRLLEAVFEFARSNGFGSVALEVVDTNPRAQQLYERMGFVARETHQYPWLYRRMGFSAVTVMSRAIAQAEG